MHVLLVEDDVSLCESIVHILESRGYTVDVVHDGQTGIEQGSSLAYDAIIMDVMLPIKDGLRAVGELRDARIGTPILMLTAKSTVRDRVEGLDAGADDYLPKPFAPSEFLARLRAITRRTGTVNQDALTAGDLSLNLDSHDLICGNEVIRLRMKEFLILDLLMRNAGRTIPKGSIIQRVWGVESDAESNNLEAHISFLRKKLRFVGSTSAIETIPKVGYRLVAEANEE